MKSKRKKNYRLGECSNITWKARVSSALMGSVPHKKTWKQMTNLCVPLQRSDDQALWQNQCNAKRLLSLLVIWAINIHSKRYELQNILCECLLTSWPLAGSCDTKWQRCGREIQHCEVHSDEVHCLIFVLQGSYAIQKPLQEESKPLDLNCSVF